MHSDRELYEYDGSVHRCDCGVMIASYRDECSRCRDRRRKLREDTRDGR